MASCVEEERVRREIEEERRRGRRRRRREATAERGGCELRWLPRAAGRRGKEGREWKRRGAFFFFFFELCGVELVKEVWRLSQFRPRIPSNRTGA
jgi:hypothetical protein